MTTVTYTRRLIEHRYGRPLEELHDEAESPTTHDPVLPIILRRYATLAQTGEQARDARRGLDLAWQRWRSGGHDLDLAEPPLLFTTEVVNLERQERLEAELLWDLLDLRLLMDQRTFRPEDAAPADHPADFESVMRLARRVADELPRLNRETLRQALRTHGMSISNERLGAVLQRLRAERDHR
ncbi:hypothetical protein [Streptomyces specialis]|uniref:hypothetical protein n=1 Tax=Streptomyces specialis TaxID=498367 RepID=UPI00073F4890|nr:hypothetical protein [Streptomyces specialis]